MKKLLLTLILATLYSYAEPICASINIKKIKNLHAKETKELRLFTLPYADDSIICETIPNSEKIVVVATYKGQDGGEDINDVSIVVAVVNRQTGKVLQSSFYKNLAISDAVEIETLTIDTKTYSQLSKYAPFGIRINQGVYVTHAHAMSESHLFLFESRKNGIKMLLDDYELEGHSMMCEDYRVCFGENIKNKITAPCKTKNYCPIRVKTLSSPYYLLPITDDEESIEKSFSESYSVKLTFQNGKYVKHKRSYSKTVEKKLTFNEVEKGAKKGKHYSRYELAKLIYEPLYGEDKFKKVAQLNNIAYYLQKSGDNLEAVMLLEVLLKEFPKRTVAYYNLGDAYWALGRKKEAKKVYETYVKQMIAKGKEKRIPKVVKERIGK